MLVYKFDEKGLFVGVDETELDPLESELQGKEIYLLPPNATFDAPEQKAGFAPVWDGEKWEQVEDNRGVEYWLEGDEYGTPARTMSELGPLPEGASLVAPEMSKEQKEAQIQAQLTNAVQYVLDAKAQELFYDNCLSVCSYIDTGVPKFDAEGKAFRAWRSAVWAKGYEILAQVQSGERGIPSEEELLAELPELVIDYSEA